MKAVKLTCRVTHNEWITPTVFHLGFTTNLEFDFIPGQFISIVIPGAGPKGRDLRRAYSLAVEPERRPIELCIKLVEGGKGTPYLNSLKPGDTFEAQAPFGDFVFKSHPEKKVIFIATGTGVSPFRSMVFSKLYASAPRDGTLLFGIRGEDEILYQDLFSKAKDLRRIDCVTKASDQFTGFRGRVTQYLREKAGEIDWQATEFYLCGNGEMIKEAKTIFEEHSVPKENIHQEKYY